jgi:hypothetical protein
MTVFLFIALLLVIGVTFTVGLVMPKKTMIITSEVVIGKPKDAVWAYVRLLRNQEKYNTWILQDRNIKMEYRGTDGTPGFIAGWQSKTRMGNGEQEILSVNEGESYEAELRFRNHDNTTHVTTSVESVDASKTKVVTVMSATPSFPMSLMMPMMKKVLKKKMDENSTKLKEILEA